MALTRRQTNPLVQAGTVGSTGANEDAQPVAIAAIWRATLRTLSLRSFPMLVCAVFGLAGADLLGQIVNSALTFDVFLHNGGILPTYASTYYAQLLIQAGIGTFAIALARGAITWITLRHAQDDKTMSLRVALRASLARLPSLLFSSLIYGAVVLMGVAGLSLLLRQLRLDVTSVGRVTGDFDSIAQVFVVRVINSFVPNPGAPLSDFLDYARYALRRSATNYYWLYAYRGNIGDVPLRIWLIGLTGFVPFAAAGTLFRLFDPAIMSARLPNRLSTLAEAVQVAAQNFRLVFKHALVLWAVGVLLNSVFVALPLVLAQYLLVPALSRSVNSLWPYPASTFLFGISATAISMLLSAFAIVYNAHLYLALSAHPPGAAKP